MTMIAGWLDAGPCQISPGHPSDAPDLTQPDTFHRWVVVTVGGSKLLKHYHLQHSSLYQS